MVDKEFLKHCPASEHWKEVGIYDHHGVALPLFSLHSQNSCQIGEYTDIFPLITWCKEVGFDVIQFLPLNDTGLGTSPYSAISAFALHPIYLGLSQLPYLEESPLLLAEIKRLQVKTESLH